MHKLEDLRIWQRSNDLVLVVYELTKFFPKEEQFGLISQVRRCVVSVASNIAEGAGRNSKGEFNQFLGYANGSLYELQTQLILAQRLNFITLQQTEEPLNEIIALQKMIYTLQSSL